VCLAVWSDESVRLQNETVALLLPMKLKILAWAVVLGCYSVFSIPPCRVTVLGHSPVSLPCKFASFANEISPTFKAISSQLVVSRPLHGCEGIAGYGNVTQPVVLVERGTCPFLDKVKMAHRAGLLLAAEHNTL
jgi:hypothetical protein